jgi:hypothetical protein
MKKTFGIIVALTLVATLGIGSAAEAATVKAGATCSRVGITKTVSSIKFTCVKSGAKLVWNRGVKLSAPAPSASPSTQAPIAPVTLDDLDPNRVRKLAYAQVMAGIASSKAFTPNITFVIGPSLTAERVDREKAGLTMASSFWSDIYKPNQVFIGYVTEKDVDWVDSAYCQQAKYCPTGNNVIVSSVIKRDAPYCNSAQATRNSEGIPFFNQCLGTGSDSLKNRQTGPHEYTHFVQQDASKIDPTVPNWWTEGSADYFGGAIGAYDGTQLPKTLDEMVHTSSYNWMQQDLCDVKSLTESAVVDCFKYTKRQATPPAAGQRWMLAHVSYYQGALATEALLALHGLDKVKKFMVDMKTQGYETSFLNNFGITSDTFYEKVAKYVVAMYKAGR